jgi:hypothetical protein
LNQRLALGAAGLRVSPICLGAVFDRRIIGAAYEAGINFFFISVDLHWSVYEETREGLRDLLRSVARDDVVIAAVTYVSTAEFALMPVMELLQAVPELERIDIYVTGGVFMSDFLPRLEMADRLHEQRFCGMQSIGASFHDRTAAAFAACREMVDVAFVRYNASHPGARRDLFPRVRDAESSTLLYNFTSIPANVVDDAAWARLNLRGHWRPQPTDFYRFALTATPLHGLLCSMRETRHVADLAGALARGPLDEEEQQYLVDLCALAEGKAQLAKAAPRTRRRR